MRVETGDQRVCRRWLRAGSTAAPFTSVQDPTPHAATHIECVCLFSYTFLKTPYEIYGEVCFHGDSKASEIDSPLLICLTISEWEWECGFFFSKI